MEKHQNSKPINVTHEDSKETNNFKPDRHPKTFNKHPKSNISRFINNNHP